MTPSVSKTVNQKKYRNSWADMVLHPVIEYLSFIWIKSCLNRQLWNCLPKYLVVFVDTMQYSIHVYQSFTSNVLILTNLWIKSHGQLHEIVITLREKNVKRFHKLICIICDSFFRGTVENANTCIIIQRNPRWPIFLFLFLYNIRILVDYLCDILNGFLPYMLCRHLFVFTCKQRMSAPQCLISSIMPFFLYSQLRAHVGQ